MTQMLSFRGIEAADTASLDTDHMVDDLVDPVGIVPMPSDDPVREVSEADQAESARPRRSSSRRSSFRSKREQWQAEYARYLLVSDSVIVCTAVGAAQYFRFGHLADGSELKWAMSAGCYVYGRVCTCWRPLGSFS